MSLGGVSPLPGADVLKMSAELGLHMGPEGMHLKVASMLANVISKLLSIIFEKCWWWGKVPDD